MGRFERIRNTVAELIDAREEEPEPEGYQGEERTSGLIRGGVLEHEPPRDELHKYWRLYESVGPIKSAINNLASEVVEPGWYITADSEETEEELTEFFTEVGIANLDNDVDASVVMEKMIIEREVRGTTFVEKVRDSQGREQALYMLQNDTITIYTKPGKAMLPAPDDDAAEPEPTADVTRHRDEPPRKENGDLGAYVQFDDIKPKWSNTEEVVYTRDQVIHWPRDADIGEPRGTSRIESSAQRAEGLLEKLNDNDDAVKFKAWPQIIFSLGTEERPWSEDEAEDFIEDYQDGNIEPGLMQAVSGDVSVEEFAGETADIGDTLEFDISMIMSGLPGPVYATGGFSQNVAPAVAQQQQRQYIKEVKAIRRELEDLLTPYLRDVARDYNLDAPDSVELHLGRPDGMVPPEDVEGSIIRYQSDVNQGGRGNGEPTVPISSDDIVNDPGDESSNQSTSGSNSNDTARSGSTNQARNAGQASAESGGMHDEHSFPVYESVDELADPRLVSTADIERELQELAESTLTSVREQAVSELRDTRDVPVSNPDGLAQASAQTAQNAIDDSELEARSRSRFERLIEDTLDTIGQDNHSPTIDTPFGSRHRRRARSHGVRFGDEVGDVVDEMVATIRTQVQEAAASGESASVVADRIENSFDDTSLSNRSQVVARIEANSAVNSVKLSEYERAPDVVGVKLINPCTTNTTPICQELACDTEAEARFDSDDTIGEQFQSKVDDDLLHDGFDPLPSIPPFHFGCRTEIVAVPESDRN